MNFCTETVFPMPATPFVSTLLMGLCVFVGLRCLREGLKMSLMYLNGAAHPFLLLSPSTFSYGAYKGSKRSLHLIGLPRAASLQDALSICLTSCSSLISTPPRS